MEYKLKCIKCAKEYDTDDPDPYYCEGCNITRLEIAKEIDKKMAGRPKRKAVSDLQNFYEIAKQRGTGNFVNAKDLGI